MASTVVRAEAWAVVAEPWRAWPWRRFRLLLVVQLSVLIAVPLIVLVPFGAVDVAVALVLAGLIGTVVVFIGLFYLLTVRALRRADFVAVAASGKGVAVMNRRRVGVYLLSNVAAFPQRQGYGRAAVRQALEWADAQAENASGNSHVELAASTAEIADWYEQFGFRRGVTSSVMDRVVGVPMVRRRPE